MLMLIFAKPLTPHTTIPLIPNAAQIETTKEIKDPTA
jgi:hypothetical protein